MARLTPHHTLTASWTGKDAHNRKIHLQAETGAGLADLARPWRRLEPRAAMEGRDPIVLPSTSVEATLEMVLARRNPSLRAYIAGRTEIDIAAAVGIARAIAVELATVHSCHVLHGSLSVDNILVDAETGSVDLIGFVAAVKLAPGAALSAAALRRVPDALAWTPELAGRSVRTVDHRTDLYALGAVLYHLVTGRRVFEAGEPGALLHAHLAKLPHPPQDGADVPPMVSAIVMALLKKQPADRYQRAVDLFIDLDACLQDLRAGTAIAEFPLRLKPASAALGQGQLLVGRDAQSGQLDKALSVARARQPQRLLVTGAAGAGKTVLCRRFAEQVAAEGGFTGLGKFEQFGINSPYLGLLRCFEDLIGAILQKPHEVVDRLAQAITTKLNGNLAFLAGFLPTLGGLVEVSAPDEPALDSGAQVRLAQCFLGLLDAVASPVQPIVLFFDDLQWADSASLGVLGDISANLAGSVVLVGTSRTDRNGSAGLTGILAVMTAQDRPPIRLDLIPLNRSDVEDLMLGVFGPRRLLIEAAAVVYAKTLGSPLFVCQFLQRLDEGLALDPTGAWDVAAIAAVDGAVDVVAFLSARIGSLDDLSRTILVTSSCFGMSFDRIGLRSLVDVADDILTVQLEALVSQGFFLPIHGGYLFSHDRVREAAYRLAVDRETIHRRIGRHLLAVHAGDDLPRAAYTIVRHLEAAGDLTGHPQLEERRSAVALLAAQRAHAAAAFDLARTYAGTVLADAGRWSDRYDTMATALILRADSTASCQDHARFDRDYEQDAARLRTDEHRLRLALSRVMSLHARALCAEAIDVGLDALRIIGIDLPGDPKAQGPALQHEIAAFHRGMGERTPDDLARLPTLDDPAIATAMQILFRLGPNAHRLMQSDLFALLAVRNANIMLAHGKDAFASGILMTLAVALARHAPETRSAEDFARVAMDLDPGDGRRRPAGVSFIYSWFFSHWLHPLEASLPSNLEGMRAGYAMGDIQFGSFHAAAYVIHLAGTGAPLRDVVRAGRDHDRLIGGRIRVASFHCRLEVAFAEALLGMTAAPTRLGDEVGDAIEDVLREAECLSQAERGFFLARHLQLTYLFGAFDDASVLVAALPGVRQGLAGNLVEADIVTFALLTALAVGRPHEAFESDLARLEGWAQRNPGNFGCRHALVAAEVAARERRVENALGLYARAIRAAKVQNFSHLAAVASERAGRFLLGLGDDVAGGAHLGEALTLYATWGADAKASALETEFALTRAGSAAGLGDSGIDRPALELTAVLAAARAISAEIEIDKLLQRLMTSVLEVSGATYGALILMQEGHPVVEVVSSHGESASVSEASPQPLEQSRLVPRSVVAQVDRERTTLVLKNARASTFAQDPYIRANEVVSALCAPLIERGRLDGFVYVENNFTVAAFDSRSARAVQVLAAQAAIALNNARLFGLLNRARADLADANRDLENKIAARTAELANARNLALEKAAEADRAREAEKRANDAKSHLLSVVGHEIRTPMNGVLGMLQLLDRSRLAPKERRRVDLAQRAGFNLVRLIDGILDFSRLELSEGAADETFELGELLESSVEIFRSSAEAKGVALLVSHDAPVGTVLRSDAHGIGRVMANLVANAVKFTDAGQVEVAMSLREGADDRGDRRVLVLRVADTGIGIEPAMRERIFEDFVQADASLARRYGGTGLGLAIARRILALLGGTIAVDSRPGVGSIFEARVPVSVAQHRADPTFAATGRPLAVLVVDDDEINREVASGLLRRLGHAVTCVGGWAAAVSAARARAFDVIMLDLHMPKVDGFETARRIRHAAGGQPCPRLVLLTADATESSQRRAVEEGIAHVLRKPLRSDELARTLAPPACTEDDALPRRPFPQPIDAALFADRCGLLGIPSMVRFIRLYDRRSRQTIQALQDAVSRRDRTAVAKLTHRLRGSSGSLDLSEVEERASLLEAAASAGSIPSDQDITELISARRRAVKAALRAIRAYRAGEA